MSPDAATPDAVSPDAVTPDAVNPAPAAARGRWTRGRAVTASLLLGAGWLITGALPWLSAEVPTVIAETQLDVSGADALPVVSAAALVTAAAGIALAIAGPVVRRLVALVHLATAGLAAVAILNLLADPAPAVQRAAAEVTGVRELGGPIEVAAGPYIALALAVLVAAHGVVVLFGRAWQASARRFERDEPHTSAAPSSDRTRAMDDWDALGRGEDPSALEDR